jgi:hypothetical protein
VIGRWSLGIISRREGILVERRGNLVRDCTGILFLACYLWGSEFN